MSTTKSPSPPTNGKHTKPEILIDAIGPIQGSLAIDLSAGPGVYVIRGSKGAGKSTAISCIELLAGHKVDITVNERSMMKGGKVSGFGSSINITKARIGKRQGTFEAEALDSEKFTISDITDPEIKDPAKADVRRINAIASLTRSKSDQSDYYELAGGKEVLESLIKPSDMQTDDPVLLASRIKAAFDAAARNAESLADRADGQAQACMESVAGLDLESFSDPDELAAAVDAAVAEKSRLATLQAEAARCAKLKAEAVAKLESTKAKSGPTLSRAEAMLASADKDLSAATAKAESLREQLRQVEAEAVSAKQRMQHAKSEIVAARHNAELVAQLEELIAKDTSPAPSQEEIDAAVVRLAEARDAQELGVRVRDGKRRLEEGNAHLQEGQLQRERAAAMRNAAAGTFGVLMRSVKMENIRIENVNGAPRLVVDHPRRGATLFSELSDGERVRATIDLLMPVIGSPGVFCVPQRISQDLPPRDWEELNAMAVERGIYCFGALVDDGTLRVERLAA